MMSAPALYYKMSNVFDLSTEEPTTSYYSIFRQFCKFIPRYRFGKRVPVTYVKFISRIGISLSEITIRIRNTLMMNCDLVEIPRRDRKTILKSPDRNRPLPTEFFGDFPC